jgi:hypothetical protein
MRSGVATVARFYPSGLADKQKGGPQAAFFSA